MEERFLMWINLTQNISNEKETIIWDWNAVPSHSIRICILAL